MEEMPENYFRPKLVVKQFLAQPIDNALVLEKVQTKWQCLTKMVIYTTRSFLPLSNPFVEVILLSRILVGKND